MLIDIKQNTDYDPGWRQNGGLFIARQKVFWCHLMLVSFIEVYQLILLLFNRLELMNINVYQRLAI